MSNHEFENDLEWQELVLAINQEYTVKAVKKSRKEKVVLLYLLPLEFVASMLLATAKTDMEQFLYFLPFFLITSLSSYQLREYIKAAKETKRHVRQDKKQSARVAVLLQEKKKNSNE